MTILTIIQETYMTIILVLSMIISLPTPAIMNHLRLIRQMSDEPFYDRHSARIYYNSRRLRSLIPVLLSEVNS